MAKKSLLNMLTIDMFRVDPETPAAVKGAWIFSIAVYGAAAAVFVALYLNFIGQQIKENEIKTLCAYPTEGWYNGVGNKGFIFYSGSGTGAGTWAFNGCVDTQPCKNTLDSEADGWSCEMFDTLDSKTYNLQVYWRPPPNSEYYGYQCGHGAYDCTFPKSTAVQAPEPTAQFTDTQPVQEWIQAVWREKCPGEFALPESTVPLSPDGSTISDATVNMFFKAKFQCSRKVDANTVFEAAGMALGWAEFVILVLVYIIKQVAPMIGLKSEAEAETKM